MPRTHFLRRRRLSHPAQAGRPPQHRAETPAPARELLRELAFVLHAARRVREELKDDDRPADPGC